MFRLLIAISLCVIFDAAPVLLAQSPPMAGPPQLIRITGKFITPPGGGSEQQLHPYPTLDVRIAEKMRTLHVQTVESLTGARDGWPILRNVGAFLTFTGPPEIIAHLRSPEVTGRLLKIEGRLYIKDRVLMLTAVEPAVRGQ